jgi:uncharacterized protein (TIGR03083 family)
VQEIRATTLATGRAIVPLLEDERVARRWSEPSALAMLSVGGLAGHLARAFDTVELYLDEPEPPDEDLLSPSAYFVGALRAAGDLSGPMHTGVRERGEDAGRKGPVALVADLREQIERLTVRLETERSDRRVTVMRGMARMTLDDYLPTRIVEMTVHADDLAASVGAEAPDLGDALDVAIDVLVATAIESHGKAAVLRALARRERDAVEALRVL